MTAISWTNSAGGDWSDAADWSTDTVPTLSHDITFSGFDLYIVTISNNAFANSLTFNAPAVELAQNAGSLDVPGALNVEAGTVSLNGANAIGSVNVGALGSVEFGNSGALGSGTVSLTDGILLGSANATLTNALSISGTSIIGAEGGTTLDENATTYTINDNVTLQIDGTVLWHTNAGSSIGSGLVVDVFGGTLKAADDRFSSLLANAGETTVEAGATLDVAGFDTAIANLKGAGTVTDSGGRATLTLDTGVFLGSIFGPLSLEIAGVTLRGGVEDYVGNTTFEGPASLTNSGTFDLLADNNINGASSTGGFANNALFEKTGGGGVSDVTSNFVNNGALNVLSGSIVFSGDFTNNGVIHGLVTQTRFLRQGQSPTTTVSAAVPSDFNGDALSDILWQNANSGQASVWDMSGNTLIGGGAVSPNPGSSWRAVA